MQLRRKEIEAWYAQQALPKREGIVYRAILDDGRLILGVYKDRRKMGIYMLHADGRRATKREECDAWGTEGIRYLLGGNWIFGCHLWDTEQCFADMKSMQIAEPYLDELDASNYGKNRITERLQRIDDHYNEARRRLGIENKRRRLHEFAAALPALPEGFDDWCRETVFGGVHYFFGKKGCDEYACTACGKKHRVKGLKDRQETVCKRTYQKVRVTKRQTVIERRAEVQVVQNMPEAGHSFGRCAVARHLYVWAEWTVLGMQIHAEDAMLLILPKARDLWHSAEPCTKWCYHLNGYFGDFWDDHNRGNFRIKREYMFPDTVKEALKDTVYDGLGLEVAAEKGWYTGYNSLMIHRRPVTEYLIKGGFFRLVDEISILTWPYVRGIKQEGKDAKDVLLLDGQGVARLRRMDGGITVLDWLQTAFMCGYKIPDRVLSWFAVHAIHSTDLAFALNQGISPESAANYIERQILLNGEKSNYLTANATIARWKDYLDMAEKLSLDAGKEMINRPKDLKGRHDELSALIVSHKDALERERIEAQYPEVIPTCDRIRPFYEWSDETYSVRVPRGAYDVIREGRLLRHCVGSTDRYFDRISENESYIMFLRKNSRPDTPWYTMEVEPGGKVRQLRTLGDEEGKDRAEAKEALRKWQSEVLKRLRTVEGGRSEINAASISREKRLREFEELRKGGNVIRNGRLAGRLLVEVLEADFKEYNEEPLSVSIGS